MTVTQESVLLLLNLLKSMHPVVILESGGLSGIRDEGGLYNSITRVLGFAERNQGHSQKVAAFIYREFATRHHFVDGNKRMAHLFAKLWLQTNNLNLKVQYRDASIFIIAIAADKKTIKEIEVWVKAHTHPFPNRDYVRRFSDFMVDLLNRR